MHKTIRRMLIVMLLFLLVILPLTACSENKSSFQNEQMLADAYLDHMFHDRYAEAKAMTATVIISEADFRLLWDTCRPLFENADAYEVTSRSFDAHKSDGTTTTVAAYVVKLDNGRHFTLQIVTQNGINGIAGIKIREATDFLKKTDGYLPILHIALIVVAVACFAFRVWMLVDCIRRPIARKGLWIVFILLSIGLGITIGETSGLRVLFSLLFDRLKVIINPFAYATTVTVSLPVGALVYLILRKRLVADTPPSVQETPPSDPVPPDEDTYTA